MNPAQLHPSLPDTTPRPSGDGGLFVPSSLWIDGDDVFDRIEARQQAGELDATTAERVRHFAEHGYVAFPLEVEPALFERLLEDVETFWHQRPRDLIYAYDGPARRMDRADEARERRSRYRLHDIHSHSAAARTLYLHPQLCSLVETMLGEAAVAIQSLFFEFGSQQTLHRDPVVVPVGAPGHLIAAWIALEDIHPDCGPLVYIPGSHRLPYYELAPDEYQYDGSRMGPEVVEAGLAWEAEQYRRHGLEPQTFTPRKGEVLLWHASLTHGGSEVRDERLTRRSFVVHYSSRSTYPERSITVAETEGDGEGNGETPRVYATRQLIGDEGALGFANPVADTLPG